MSNRYRTLITAFAALAALYGQVPAYADPPSWAPAYGARDHDEDRRQDGDDRYADHHGDHDSDRGHDGNRDRDRDRDHDYDRRGDWDDHHGYYGYRGYRGDGWHSDYGVVSNGHCNTNVLLGVAGAVGGAVIGNSTASPQNRDVATVFGAIAGGIIGSAVGGAIDNGDRACFGHSLELAPIGHPVVWSNPRSHVAWRVVPMRDISRDCREFDVRRDYRGHYGTERVTACRRGRGEWAFRS